MCREESPILRAFGVRAEGKVPLLGIDYNDPQPALAIEFAGLVGWKQPQLADPDKVLEGPLKFPGIPMTLLVDAEGRVVASLSGQRGEPLMAWRWTSAWGSARRSGRTPRS